MKTTEQRIRSRVQKARRNGLTGIYVWSPWRGEINAFAAASAQGEWSAEGERLRMSTLEMLGESLSEEGGASWLKLAVGMSEAGQVVAFGLLDEDSVEHGFELITLAAQEGKGFGSALLAAVAQRVGGGELFLNAGPSAEGYYDLMGLEGADGWRSLPGEICQTVGKLLNEVGITIQEQAPVLD